MVRNTAPGSDGAFAGRILKVGINPYLRVPAKVLASVLEKAGRDRGPIPVKGTLNGTRFRQTLVKHQGIWRLYLNTPMRQRAGLELGDVAAVTLVYDARPPKTPMNAALAAAITENAAARDAFEALTPSHKKEILRYLNSMKTEASLARNVENVLRHLTGKRPHGIHAVLRVKG
ncbi:MAG TPA: YdeI/OmpD-associated family protein [Polyangiaceae bacterium]|jgi:hypothetical protein|nr:YdeI/OmpD-associated family protein [Polyangiaceae bacterium]